MSHEDIVKKHVSRVLSKAGLDKTLEDSDVAQVKSQIVDLFRDYSRSPEQSRAEAYERGEAKILNTLRKAHRTKARHSSGGLRSQSR
jgi:hypothetical protein